MASWVIPLRLNELKSGLKVLRCHALWNPDELVDQKSDPMESPVKDQINDVIRDNKTHVICQYKLSREL